MCALATVAGKRDCAAPYCMECPTDSKIPGYVLVPGEPDFGIVITNHWKPNVKDCSDECDRNRHCETFYYIGGVGLCLTRPKDGLWPDKGANSHAVTLSSPEQYLYYKRCNPVVDAIAATPAATTAPQPTTTAIAETPAAATPAAATPATAKTPQSATTATPRAGGAKQLHLQRQLNVHERRLS